MNITDGQLESIDIEVGRFEWASALFSAIKQCGNETNRKVLCDLGNYIAMDGYNTLDGIIGEVKCSNRP